MACSMMNKSILIMAAFVLVGCADQESKVRVESVKPEPAPAPAAKARTEPIFYNGKTYTLKFAPAGQGNYNISVLGMSGKQQKDAVAVGTSAIRYFACPDEKAGKLTEQARYVGDAWRMQARCA
jgi:lipopolysaccharide export system protein LptC